MQFPENKIIDIILAKLPNPGVVGIGKYLFAVQYGEFFKFLGIDELSRQYVVHPGFTFNKGILVDKYIVFKKGQIAAIIIGAKFKVPDIMRCNDFFGPGHIFYAFDYESEFYYREFFIL